MSYEPTTWKAGDKVTSAKLNKMEQGIANSDFLVVEYTNNYMTGEHVVNKTWQEIYDAFPKVILYEIHEDSKDAGPDILAIGSDNAGYYINFKNSQELTCNSPNEYPSGIDAPK